LITETGFTEFVGAKKLQQLIKEGTYQMAGIAKTQLRYENNIPYLRVFSDSESLELFTSLIDTTIGV
jgi:hypothetical protein